MKEYDERILKKIQKTELDILKDVIKVCEENDLRYFGLAGTGIGALRHSGFIPWDDDIDIGLIRSDYDKLISIIKNNYSEKYTIVNGDEYNAYPLMTTRIVRNGTVFVEETLKNIKDCPLGIFLDVYAFDNVAKDKTEAKKQGFRAWLFSKMLIMKSIPFPVVPFNGFLKKAVHCITALVYAFLNITFISPSFFYRKAKYYSTAHNSEECDAYAYFCDTDRYSNYFNKEDLFPLKKIQFEDLEMYFPNNLEKHLRYLFDNYMELPPIDKRKNHFPYKLKFLDEEEIINE